MCLLLKEKKMIEQTDDIKTTIRIAKAIEEDIREYKSFDIQAAYLHNEQRLNMIRKSNSFTYYLLRIAAVLLLPLVISTGTLFYLYIHQLKQVDAVSYLDASSAPGIVTQVLLSDSSRVWLNAGSTLRYPSHFTKKDRTVQLNGEGYFEVQSDKEHPFYVSLYNGMRVKAYGTKFNISAYESDSLMETTLETGCVDVLSGSSNKIVLKPNEQIVYNKKKEQFILRTINIEEKTAWKDGRLVFRNATLEDVIKQLSRRYNIDIVLHKETTKNYKFRATFSTENITQILDYLRMAAPITWSFTTMEQKLDYSFPRQRIDVWLK